MEVNQEKVAALYVILMAGCLANLFLLLSLLLTWKYWRQVKWYIIALAAANWLELAFRFGMELGWHHTLSWQGPELSCKLLMMMRLLGISLALMVVAALAVQTLLTVLTGSQGERLRHLLVLGLFVLLSLPLPLTQIAVFRLMPIPFLSDGSQQCVTFSYFQSPDQKFHYNIGFVIALVYFPVVVFIVCGAVSTVLTARRKGNVKGDEHASDLIITVLLGVVVLVCSVPVFTYIVVHARGDLTLQEQKVYEGLNYLENCRNILSALLTAGFAYLYVYRKRKTLHLTPTIPDAANGERQRLVK